MHPIEAIERLDHLLEGDNGWVLDPRQFVRVHRRDIVNVDRVTGIQPWFGGDYVAVLDNGDKLRLARHFREQFQTQMLGG